MIRRAALCLGLGLAFAPMIAGAVQPDEVLPDRVLEQRARDLSAGLRCMVCQNQSIDESDAPLAKDLRVLVRQRLVAGDSDAEVEDYLVSRYGEFVLLRPRVGAGTIALWAMPVLLLVVGGVFLVLAGRRRQENEGTVPLSADEERRLDALLAERRDALTPQE